MGSRGYDDGYVERLFQRYEFWKISLFHKKVHAESRLLLPFDDSGIDIKNELHTFFGWSY